MTDRTSEQVFEFARRLYDARDVVIRDRIGAFLALWTGERATRRICPTCAHLVEVGPLSARCRRSVEARVSRWRQTWIPLGDDLPRWGAYDCPAWDEIENLEDP